MSFTGFFFPWFSLPSHQGGGRVEWVSSSVVLSCWLWLNHDALLFCVLRMQAHPCKQADETTVGKAKLQRELSLGLIFPYCWTGPRGHFAGPCKGKMSLCLSPQSSGAVERKNSGFKTKQTKSWFRDWPEMSGYIWLPQWCRQEALWMSNMGCHLTKF